MALRFTKSTNKI